MLRHPIGILSLVLMLLAAATVADGLAQGTFSEMDIRGETILPGILAAIVVLLVAGRHRGLTALVAESSAVLGMLWGLNYARLVLKYRGDGQLADQAVCGVLAAGFLAAGWLLLRSRPRAEDGDWHRGSAIAGAMLWMTGLRTGPGSRAGLGLTALVLTSALLAGAIEKVERASALGRSVIERWSGQDREPSPAIGDWASPSPRSAEQAETTATAPAAETPDDRDDRDAADDEPMDAATEPTSGAGRSWFAPSPERRLAPRIRPAADRVQTRIRIGGSAGTSPRMGPWAGVLADRPIRRGGTPGTPGTPRTAAGGQTGGLSGRLVEMPAPVPAAAPAGSPRDAISARDAEEPGTMAVHQAVEPDRLPPLLGPLEVLHEGPLPIHPVIAPRIDAPRVTETPRAARPPAPAPAFGASPRPPAALDPAPSAPGSDSPRVRSRPTIVAAPSPAAPAAPAATAGWSGAAQPATPLSAAATSSGPGGPGHWADPHFAVAADAGALRAPAALPAPLAAVLVTVAGLLTTLGAVTVRGRRRAAGVRGGDVPVTATTGAA